MEKLFLTVLGMSGTASLVILAVLLARLALRKTPKVFSYALWAVVLFRLLCPFSIESAFSLAPRVQVRSGERNGFDVVTVDVERREVTITVNDGPAALPEPPVIDTPADPAGPTPSQPDAPAAAAPAAPGRWFIAGVVWLTVAGLLMGYSLLSLLKLRRKLVGSVPLAGEDHVRLADHIPSPFVLGLARPQIYLPSGLPEHERDYILLHERTHIARFDHVTRALAWLALAVHWFNPLVWLSFYLARKDMEMSCDEAVLRRMGREVRVDYSSSLLRLSAGGKLPTGPLAFGGGAVPDRIKNVLRYKKPALWVIAAALTVVVCAGAALATSPGGMPEQEPSGSGLEDLSADLTFSPGDEGPFVRIEGSVDGLGLEHTLWYAPSWFEAYGDTRYPLGQLRFEMLLCGGQVLCPLDACWTDESRTAVRVTATPSALFSSYSEPGNLFITVDLSDGTLLELDGYLPKLSPNDPERVPTEAEAVRAARVAAVLLKEAEAFYESASAPGPAVIPSPEPSSGPAGLPWEVPEADAPSYEDYFAQVIDYHYPGPDVREDWLVSTGYNIDPYMLVYEEPDLYLSQYYAVWLEGRRPDLWLWQIAEISNLKIFCADKTWIYAVVDGKELIRMNYFGEVETLFTDEAGLIDVYCLADGKVLYFWAGLPEGGAAIYRLYIPEGRVDALYRITREELEQYYYEPPANGWEAGFSRVSAGYLMGVIEPVSNFEFAWTTVNRKFWELYDSLVLHAEDYPQYFDQGLEDLDIIFRIEVDYGVSELTNHYFNAHTGEHLTRQQSSYSNPMYPWWKD